MHAQCLRVLEYSDAVVVQLDVVQILIGFRERIAVFFGGREQPTYNGLDGLHAIRSVGFMILLVLG